MNKKIENVTKMTQVQKVTQVQKIGHTKKQVIVNQKTTLIEGHFISSRFDNGFSLNGGHINELTRTQVTSVTHPALIITILLEGTLKFGYDDLSFQLDSRSHAIGVAVNLTRTTNFRRDILPNNRVKKLHLIVSPEWIKNRSVNNCDITKFTKLHKSNAFFEVTPSMHQIASEIMVSNNRSSFIQSLQYETLAYTLFSKVLTQLIISKNTLALTSFQKVKQTYSLPSNVITTNNIDNTVSEVLSYIESHLNQSLTLEQIAKKFSMSISNLQRKFKLTLKLTVNNYIRYRRLEIAKYHLEQGIKGVTEVAYEAGYNHPANFTNAFKKKFGHPPTTFVKNNNSHTWHD